MHLNELGFDYSNLTSCTIKKKSSVMIMIALIISFSIFWIFLTFLILYLMDAPMHINGVYVNPEDPLYQSFFISTLGVLLGIFALGLIVGLVGLLMKPRVFMIVDNDQDMNRFYYIYHRAKRQEIYLTDQYAVIYREAYHTATYENNKDVVQDLHDKFIFWEQFQTLTDYKIKEKNKTMVLKFKDNRRGRFVTLIKRYSFSKDINVVPVIVKERIDVRAGGNYRPQAASTFYFDDINRKPEYQIHQEIKNTLSRNF
ncbi:MAG TPA: hypothetical protein PK113_01695 [Bacillota bacterium]|nr:hypothetical protein [Bacillota bacterium]